MPWILLMLSAMLEAVWATALGASQGWSVPVPTTIFVVALVLSTAGLGMATRRIPIGTAYAVWVGVGAALTAGWAMLTGTETVSGPKGVFLVGIVLSVVGMKLLAGSDRRRERPRS